ncbi:MAG: KH domain-containing protein, partial [Candidatus Bathyarchaeia archaeon]
PRKPSIIALRRHALRMPIKNALKPATVQEVRITQRPDGKTIAVVSVHPREKGVAIGKNGRNAERLRMLVKRYFQIHNVSII